MKLVERQWKIWNTENGKIFFSYEMRDISYPVNFL